MLGDPDRVSPQDRPLRTGTQGATAAAYEGQVWRRGQLWRGLLRERGTRRRGRYWGRIATGIGSEAATGTKGSTHTRKARHPMPTLPRPKHHPVLECSLQNSRLFWSASSKILPCFGRLRARRRACGDGDRPADGADKRRGGSAELSCGDIARTATAAPAAARSSRPRRTASAALLASADRQASRMGGAC